LRLFVQSIFKIPWSIKKLWTGHKICPITDNVNLWSLGVTLEVGLQVLYMTYHLIIVTIYDKLFQNTLSYEDVLDRTQNKPITDYVNSWPLGVTLTLEVEIQVLRMTHCLIIVAICAKYFQNLLTGHKLYSVTDYVNIWPPSVTLTLEVKSGCCAWHIVLLLWTLVASIYKIPSRIRKLWVRTRHTPSNRKCWPWMSKCDLVPGGMIQSKRFHMFNILQIVIKDV
jgi:hypothetical protein